MQDLYEIQFFESKEQNGFYPHSGWIGMSYVWINFHLRSHQIVCANCPVLQFSIFNYIRKSKSKLIDTSKFNAITMAPEIEFSTPVWGPALEYYISLHFGFMF